MKRTTSLKSPAPGIGHIAKTTGAIVSLSGIVTIGAMTTPDAKAADNSWATTASGTWSTSSNWTGGSIVPGNASSGATATADVATFNTSGTKTITLDAGRTIGGISYNGAGTTNIGTSSTTDNLYLSSGGILQTTAGGGALNYNTRLIISGANATYTIRNSSSNAGGSVQLNGTISGGTSGATTLTLDGSNANTFNRLNSSVNNGSSTSLAVVKNGTGFWALRASNNFSGGLTLNAGTLSFNNAGAFGTGAITINGGSIDGSAINSRSNTQNWNGNFTFAGSGNLDVGTGAVTMNATRTVTTTANTLTVGGAIGDSGSAFGLTKAGAGTLALGGASTYTGATTVNAGTLLVNGSLASGSAVSVNSSGTLGGSGTIGGATTLAAGSKLSAGSGSAATLTFTGSLDIAAAANNSSAFVFDLGTSFDLVSSGVLTIGSNLLDASDFSFTAGTGFGTNQNYTLFQNSGLSGTFSSFSVTDIGGSGIDGTISLLGNDIVLTTVPEPSVFTSILLGLSCLMISVWWKRRVG